MSSNNNKTNQKPHHTPANEPQAGKRGLLLSFIIFIAWVIVIGLLLSLMSCQPNKSVIFVIRMGGL